MCFRVISSCLPLFFSMLQAPAYWVVMIMLYSSLIDCIKMILINFQTSLLACRISSPGCCLAGKNRVITFINNLVIVKKPKRFSGCRYNFIRTIQQLKMIRVCKLIKCDHLFCVFLSLFSWTQIVLKKPFLIVWCASSARVEVVNTFSKYQVLF